MLLYSCLKFDCRVDPISCQNLICYGGSRFIPTNIHVCYFTKFLFLLFALQPMPSFYDMFHHHQHVVICAKFVSTEHGNTEFSFFSVVVVYFAPPAWFILLRFLFVLMQQDFLQNCIAPLVPRDFLTFFTVLVVI